MATYERVVYTISAEDIEDYAPEFYEWLNKQDDEMVKRSVDDAAEELMDYLDYMIGDGMYECIKAAMKHAGYKGEEE